MKIFYAVFFMLSISASQSSFAQITMTFPKATTYINTVAVGWTTSSAPSKIQMVWKYVSGSEAVANTIDTLTFSSANTISSGSFTFNPMTVTTNSNFASTSLNTAMPDGTWTVSMYYTRASDGVKFSSSSVTLTSSTHTLAATFPNPAPNSTVGATFPLKFTLTSVPSLAAGAVNLYFAQGTDTIAMNMTTVRVDSFTLNTANLTTPSSSINSVTPAGSVLTEGSYNVVLSYSDASGHPPAVTVNQNVTVDLHTQAPSISNADGSNNTGHIIDLSYTLPEAALAQSVTLTLTNGGTTNTLVLSTTAAGTYPISIDFNNIAATPGLISSTASTLPSGSYTVGIAYQDAVANPAASATGPTLNVTTATASPIINAPVSGTSTKQTLHIDFTLPSTALAGSVKLVFATPLRSDTLVLSSTTSTSFDLNTTAVSAGGNILSSTASSFAEGSYILKLLYQDQYANATASTAVTPVIIDRNTLTASLITPASSATNVDNIPVNYTLPEAALPGSVQLQFVGCTPVTVTLNQETAGSHTVTIDGNSINTSSGVTSTTANSLAMGSYGAVILSYQDALGNAKSYAVASNYSFSSTLPVTLSELQGTLQGLKTLLLWKTFEESNSSFFDVEYSNNAVNFQKVGQVPASGNSTTEKDYRFVHPTPTPGKNFYRLRMVDKDGVFKYSDVIAVNMDNGKFQFRVYPDPASTQINVLIVDAEDNHTHILKIWDNTGRIVKKVTVTPVPGSNIFTIPMGDLVSGMYLLQYGDNITSFVKL